MAEIIPFARRPERRSYRSHVVIGLGALAVLVGGAWYAHQTPEPRPDSALSGGQRFSPDLNTFLPEHNLIRSCKKPGRKAVYTVLTDSPQDVVLGIGGPKPKEGSFDNGLPLTEPQIKDGVRITGTLDQTTVTPLYGPDRAIFPQLLGNDPVRLPVTGDYALAVGRTGTDGKSEAVIALACTPNALSQLKDASGQPVFDPRTPFVTASAAKPVRS